MVGYELLCKRKGRLLVFSDRTREQANEKNNSITTTTGKVTKAVTQREIVTRAIILFLSTSWRRGKRVAAVTSAVRVLLAL